ncbi:hypothetical protein NDU88_005840 [Pleurodeles waltl]|uniref:Uncharacterized protein n=1 Tax=Pleurodeles waltl TaxID=8319 RepID=A0AAV7VPC9_PLEWA|nr:hypothetical protein NDU88_005840 [Pleurodeles waltl]
MLINRRSTLAKKVGRGKMCGVVRGSNVDQHSTHLSQKCGKVKVQRVAVGESDSERVEADIASARTDIYNVFVYIK